MKTFDMDRLTIMILAYSGVSIAASTTKSILMLFGMSHAASLWITLPLTFVWLTQVFWYFTPEENKQWLKNIWLPKRKQDNYILPQDHNINISKYTTGGNTYYVMRVTDEADKEYLTVKSTDLKELQDKQRKMQ